MLNNLIIIQSFINQISTISPGNLTFKVIHGFNHRILVYYACIYIYTHLFVRIYLHYMGMIHRETCRSKPRNITTLSYKILS